MSAQLDQIDGEIAMWERRRLAWLHINGSAFALRAARACMDEIEKLRRQRLVLTEQTERK